VLRSVLVANVDGLYDILYVGVGVGVDSGNTRSGRDSVCGEKLGWHVEAGFGESSEGGEIGDSGAGPTSVCFVSACWEVYWWVRGGLHVCIAAGGMGRNVPEALQEGGRKR
jgi:hypothetical protein